MKKLLQVQYLIAGLVLLSTLGACLGPSGKQAAGSASQDWPIVVRRGDQLFEGQKLFRFMSLAAPNIQQNESQIRPDHSNRFPDEYEIRDLLGAIQRMGGRVTRSFSLSVAHPADSGLPVYISARRSYNEEAFRCLDRILALCPEYDVRIILPFIASQSFTGIRGVDEFAALAGKPRGAFWTDPELKADFRHFLHFLLNRKNTVSGLLYKDDPAVLAWQLGNEFGSYAGDRAWQYNDWEPHIRAWSLEMAAYIKQLDPKHLVMEAGGCDREAILASPHIDLVSEHLFAYWQRLSGQATQLAPLALQAAAQCKGRKAILVDEFGLASVDNLRELMAAIRQSNIAGGLLWSLRGHRRDGGWYYHNEGGTPIHSFHYPGFAVGHAYAERQLLDLLRTEAFLISGLPPIPPRIPCPPPVLFRQANGLTWRGATGAAYYSLERADKPDGPWNILATGLHDAVMADVQTFEFSAQAALPLVLYSDETALPGRSYFYRLRAHNELGFSDYSPLLKMVY